MAKINHYDNTKTGENAEKLPCSNIADRKGKRTPTLRNLNLYVGEIVQEIRYMS